MRPASRRALLGVTSIAAVLLPAAGIAYLGAVSYREDRGIVAARLEEQFAAARAVAAAVEAEVLATLDGVAADARAAGAEAPGPPGGPVQATSAGPVQATSAGPAQAPPDGPAPPDDPGPAQAPPDGFERARARWPLAAHPFHIRRGQLVSPAPDPLGGPPVRADDLFSLVPRTCPERGFDRCIRAIRAARRRQAQLEAARRRELGDCAQGPCARDARRTYAALARWDDTGPDALLGLARIARRRGDADTAARHLRTLGERFGAQYDREQVSYALIADLGAARASAAPDARLAVLRGVLDRRYRAPTAALSLVADELVADLRARPLAPAHARPLAELTARLAAVRRRARYARALAGEVEELARSATVRARARPALTAPQRTLIYRLDGADVIGVAVDRAMLEQVAARAGVDLTVSGARAIVERLGDPRDEQRAARVRTLASASFGPVLPHLQLALVNDRDEPDPLDDTIEARGRRHLAITGALVALLLVGLVATIRGASRARELARLKSDLVSTVSHELKTPLTSIRMFGEMLEQGVADGDREREARYQRIIVKESERLGLLIANLLDYAQIERGTRRYQARREPAIAIAREAVATFQRVREGELPTVRVTAPRTDPAAGAAPEIMVDREVVVQSLLNLLSNAAKYGGLDEPIDVAVRAAGDEVALSVTDRGPGIPAAEHERIFREFYRTPAAHGSGVEGTGLGLALVKRHVEAQGGRVEVDSEQGRGATFALVFPLADAGGEPA